MVGESEGCQAAVDRTNIRAHSDARRDNEAEMVDSVPEVGIVVTGSGSATLLPKREGLWPERGSRTLVGTVGVFQVRPGGNGHRGIQYPEIKHWASSHSINYTLHLLLL